jgi:hypothetical protein
MQVADGVHRLTQGVVNFYLVEDGGKLVRRATGRRSNGPPGRSAARRPIWMPSC